MIKLIASFLNRLCKKDREKIIISDEQIYEAIKTYKKWMIEEIDKMMQNNFHFMSFIIMSCIIDHLAGYRYPGCNVNKRYTKFIKNYFPSDYKNIAKKIYTNFRCKLVHEFSTRGFWLKQDSESIHLEIIESNIVLDSKKFHKHLLEAAERYFKEVETDSAIRENMKVRLQKTGSMEIIRILEQAIVDICKGSISNEASGKGSYDFSAGRYNKEKDK